MTRGMLFWVIFIIGTLFGLYVDYTPGQPYPFKRGMWVVVIFILLGLLGWSVFGPAVKG